MSQSFRSKVESGYDRVADAYLASKDPKDPVTLAALEEIALHLRPGSAVLDLGCGAGIPATRWLAERFAVTGVDFSGRQLQLARRNAPGATFLRADMTELRFAPETFDAAIALHSIIHVPRSEHGELLNRIHRWLKPGGLFLATWAVGAWEGEEDDWEGWGAPMLWSHHDAKTSLRMMRDTRYEVISSAIRTSNHADADEAWLWVLARAVRGQGDDDDDRQA